ncbi:MAG: glycosyltransferase family 9 protein, partial [Terriglobales bacterium]
TEHSASMWHYLGLPPAELGPARILPAPEAVTAVARRLAPAGLRGGYAFINAFPRQPDMRWPAESYAGLLAWLRERWQLGAVLAHPAAPEPAVADPLLRAGATLVAPTSVAELIAVIAGARIVIGSDGGPLHIAAALGKPVLALFGPTDAETWAPWRTPHRLLIAPGTAVPAAAAQAAAQELLADATGAAGPPQPPKL